jgi:hypothetical protein
MSVPILELRLHFWSGLRIYDGDGTLVGKYRSEKLGTPDDRQYRGVIVTPHDEIEWFMEYVGKVEDSDSGRRVFSADETPLGLAVPPLIYGFGPEPIARIDRVSARLNPRKAFRVTSADHKPLASVAINMGASRARIGFFKTPTNVPRQLIVTAALAQQHIIRTQGSDGV